MFAQVMGVQQLKEVRRAEVGVNMPGSLLRNSAQGCVSRWGWGGGRKINPNCSLKAFTHNHRQKLEDDPDTQEISGAFEAATCYLENP